MNYQKISNLQFRLLPKNSLHSFCINLRDTSREKDSLNLLVSLAFFCCLGKRPIFISNLKDFTGWLLQDKYSFHSTEILVEKYWSKHLMVDKSLVHLHKSLGEPQFDLLSRSDGYLSCGKLGVDVSSTSELLIAISK